MYVKLLKDKIVRGRQYREGDVVYLSAGKKAVEDGEAEEIDYDEWHKENGGKPNITLTENKEKK
jgi:hypothetical protein